jgi:hypothetical protein
MLLPSSGWVNNPRAENIFGYRDWVKQCRVVEGKLERQHYMASHLRRQKSSMSKKINI